MSLKKLEVLHHYLFQSDALSYPQIICYKILNENEKFEHLNKLQEAIKKQLSKKILVKI